MRCLHDAQRKWISGSVTGPLMTATDMARMQSAAKTALSKLPQQKAYDPRTPAKGAWMPKWKKNLLASEKMIETMVQQKKIAFIRRVKERFSQGQEVRTTIPQIRRLAKGWMRAATHKHRQYSGKENTPTAIGENSYFDEPILKDGKVVGWKQ